MRTSSYLMACIVLFLWSVSAVAQDDRFEAKSINVEETTKAMSKGEQSGFKIIIHQIDVAKAKELWNKAAKEQKSKVEIAGNESIVKEALVKSISQKPLNIYALFLPQSGYVEWYTFFEMDSAFLSKEKTEVEYLAAKQFVRDFAIKAYKKGVEMEITNEEKKLDEIQKELDKLIKENEKLNSSIDGAERSINTDKDKISTAEMNIGIAQDKLGNQKQETARQSTEELIKSSQKKEKEFEKELNGLLKDKENLYKDIDKKEAEIRDAERKIEDNQHAIEMKQKEVSDQKEVIAKIQQKLGNIR